MRVFFAVLCFSIFLFLSCSKLNNLIDDAKDDGKDDGKDDPVGVFSAPDMVADAELSSEIINMQLDEVIDAIASGDINNSALSLGLLEDTITKTRTCTTDTLSKTAKVTFKIEGQTAINISTINHSVVINTINSEENRVWSNENLAEGISCITTGNLAGRYPKILWNNVEYVNGLKLSMDFKKNLKHNMTLTFDDTTTKQKSIKHEKIGTRTIKWKVNDNNDITTTDKTISFMVDTQKTFQKFNGEEKNIFAKHQTLTDLNIQTTREPDGDPISHIIKSGKVAIIANDKFYTTISFNQLTYILNSTSQDPCTPQSGEIEFNIYNSEPTQDTKPLQTIVITFGSEIQATVDGQANNEILQYLEPYKMCSFKLGIGN